MAQTEANFPDKKLFQAVAAYVPATLWRTPDLQHPVKFRGRWHTLLYADISGFSALWNQLEQAGRRGPEKFTALLNGYFEDLLLLIEQTGGTALKFGGDSLLAVWSGTNQFYRATNCAGQIGKIIESYRRKPGQLGNFRLEVTVGLHSGTLVSTVIGDPDVRLEYLVTGPAVRQTLLAEARAHKGEVLLTPELHARLIDYPEFQFEPVRRAGTTYYRLMASANCPKQSFKPRRERLPINLADRLAYLQKFIPYPVMQRLQHSPDTRLESEHRQVTSVFLVVKAPSAPLPMASWLAEFERLFRLINQLVQQYGGVLVRLDSDKSGDRLLVLFGAPVQNENDTLHALICSWQFLAELTATGNLLTVAGGIATGLVLCTEIGAAWRKEYTVMGSSINRAARLATHAQPGQIMLDETTLQNSKGRFNVQPHRLKLKGFEQPVRVYSLTGLRDVELPNITLPPVGRQSELAHFRQSLKSLQQQKQGSFIALTGEAGLGKTYLLNWFKVIWRESAGNLTCLETEATVYLSLSPYQLWLDLLDKLGQTADLGHLARADRLREVAKRFALAELTENGWALEQLITKPSGTPTASPRPDRQGQEAFKPSFYRLVWTIIKNAAQPQGLLLILDNLQWSDPSSIELLQYISPLLKEAPVLIVLACRPAQTPHDETAAWLEKQVSPLRLAGLNRTQLKQQLKLLLKVEVADELIEAAMLHCAGNPLYLEELVRYWRATGQLKVDETAGYCTWREGKLPELPGGQLTGLIMSGLDKLNDEEREVLRAAAVVGWRFETAQVGWLVASELLGANALKNLCAKGWLLPENEANTYRFRQPFARQVIYDSLTSERRQQLHGKLARAIERYGATSENLELLAIHYGRSAYGEAAFHYLTQLGHKAVAGYAYKAAWEAYRLALDWLPQLQTPALDLAELYAQAGWVARLNGQHERALDLFGRLLRLAQEETLAEREFEALNGLAVIYRLTGRLNKAVELAQQSLTLAQKLNSPARLAEAHDYLGAIYFHLGNFKAALTNFEAAIRLNRQNLANPDAQHYAQEQLAQSIGNTGLIYACTGRLNLAYHALQEALEIVTSLNLKYRIITNLINLGELCQVVFDLSNAISYHKRAVELAQQAGVPDLEAEARRNLGADYLLTQDYRQAQAHLLAARDLAERYELPYVGRRALENLTELYLAKGNLRQASVLLQQLRTETTPDLSRLEAEYLAKSGQPEAAAALLLPFVGREPHQHWLNCYRLAIYYRQARDEMNYRKYMQKAVEGNHQTQQLLEGSPLHENFRRAPTVVLFWEEYARLGDLYEPTG
jgi:class 3 adenylate cyclase/tetratricopeptide (TPR) repeat protein